MLNKETPQTLNLSITAVKTRKQRARLRLRRLLDVYFRPLKGRVITWVLPKRTQSLRREL